MDNGLQMSASGTAQALKSLALRRDPDAWTLLLRQHGPEIVRASRRILNDEALAEDACQETLLQIRDRAGQFRGGNLPAAQADSAARNWIMRIACNTALHILRTRKRAKHREEAAQYRSQPIEVATAAELEERDALARLVRGELADMPDKQRRPLVLHFFGGLSYDQLAQELQCNAGAARVRVHRALEKLRQRLSGLGVIFSATALYALLESSTAQAAEAVISAERLAQWHGLLSSTSSAAINVVSDPQFPMVAQAGYAAAVAALCGALAFGRGTVDSNGANVEEPTLVVNAPTTSYASEKPTPEIQPTRTTRYPELPRTETARPAPKVAPAQKRPETPQSGMVSPVAQLKLLQTMQQELNRRVEVLNSKLVAARTSSPEEQAEMQQRLEKLAAEQEEIARLIRGVADQIDVGSKP